MKKLIIYLICISILILSFTGGRKNSNTPSNPQTNNTNNTGTKVFTIADYYPFKENIEMIYEGKGNEYASQNIMTDFIKGNLVQIRIDSGGTVVGRLMENKNGELSILYNKEEFYYKDDLTTLASNSSNKEILLKEPLVVGTSWTLPNGSKRSITSTSANITTPSGNYTALEVTTESPNSKTKDYYVLNIGFVKSIFSSEGFDVSSSLKEIRNDAALTQNMQLFYPYATDNDIKVASIKTNISLKTNEDIKPLLEQYFKKPPKENLLSLISKGTKINKLYLNTQNNTVIVDFSKELIDEMNAGSSAELAIVKSITNTLGSYYSTDKVYITVEGNPYSSGHIVLTKDEPFKVNFTDSIELK